MILTTLRIKVTVLAVKFFSVWCPAGLSSLSLFMCDMLSLSYPVLLHSNLPLWKSSSLILFLFIDHVVPSAWNRFFYLANISFFEMLLKEIHLYIFSVMSPYHRLSFRVHGLCILYEFMTFLSLDEQIFHVYSYIRCIVLSIGGYKYLTLSLSLTSLDSSEEKPTGEV